MRLLMDMLNASIVGLLMTTPSQGQNHSLSFQWVKVKVSGYNLYSCKNNLSRDRFILVWQIFFFRCSAWRARKSRRFSIYNNKGIKVHKKEKKRNGTTPDHKTKVKPNQTLEACEKDSLLTPSFLPYKILTCVAFLLHSCKTVGLSTVVWPWGCLGLTFPESLHEMLYRSGHQNCWGALPFWVVVKYLTKNC